VPSNLTNQVDHLTALLAQRLDRLPKIGGDANDDAFAHDLREAVSQVRDKRFESRAYPSHWP
jgi:hypothetical protein